MKSVISKPVKPKMPSRPADSKTSSSFLPASLRETSPKEEEVQKETDNGEGTATQAYKACHNPVASFESSGDYSLSVTS